MLKSILLLLCAAGLHAQSLASLQAAYRSHVCGATFCWNMTTFQPDAPNGWATPDVDPNTFSPTVNIATLTANIDSWMVGVVNAGCGYVYFTAKHLDGFSLWPTAYHTAGHPPYSIAQTAWYAANGNPDIVAIFAARARAHGLLPAFYFTIADRTFEHQMASCGNRTGPLQVTQAPQCYTDYMPMLDAQLTELLTNYGPIMAIVTDSWGWLYNHTNIDFATIYNRIKTLQPGCMLIENDHLFASSPGDIVEYEISYGDAIAPSGNVRPSEGWVTARYGDAYWFYNPGQAALYSASYIFSPRYMYNQGTYYNTRNGNYNINFGPDRAGVVPPAMFAAFREWRHEALYPVNIAAGAAVSVSSTYPGTGIPAVLTDGVLLNVFGVPTTMLATNTTDTTPYAEIDLVSVQTVGRIEIFNRSDIGAVRPGRLRDLTVTLYDAGHAQVAQVTGINAGNLGYGTYVGDGTYDNGPGPLTVSIAYTAARYVRISRTRDASAVGGDDQNTLNLAEVQVFGRRSHVWPFPFPSPIG